MDSPGPGVTGTCELSDVCVGNLALGSLWKSGLRFLIVWPSLQFYILNFHFLGFTLLYSRIQIPIMLVQIHQGHTVSSSVTKSHQRVPASAYITHKAAVLCWQSQVCAIRPTELNLFVYYLDLFWGNSINYFYFIIYLHFFF